MSEQALDGIPLDLYLMYMYTCMLYDYDAFFILKAIVQGR